MGNGIGYSVKLYGSLSDDRDRFAHQLAGVLKVDPELALELMQRVPVVIVRDVSKHQAESLANDLAAIQALYLVEADGRELESEEQPKPLIPVPLEQPPEEQDEEKLRHGYWGMGAIIAAVSIVVIVGLMSLYSIYKKIRVQHQPTVTSPSVEKTHSSSDEHSGQDQPSVESLRQRVGTLESRNEDLKSSIELKRQEVKEMTSSNRRDYKLIRRSQRELADLRGELRSNLREIKQLEEMVRRITAPPPAPIRFR